MKYKELLHYAAPLPWPDDLDADAAPYFESRNPNNTNYALARHSVNRLDQAHKALKTAMQVIKECDPDTVRMYSPEVLRAIHAIENVS